METKKEFILAIRESIKPEYLNHFNEDRRDDPKRYYDDKYAEPIKAFFNIKGFKSYELNRSKRYKCTPICSLLSSGRLCYLDFISRDFEHVEFEKPLYNDLPKSKVKNMPTKMDAVIGNTYYECKCQEITSKSHGGLKKKYLFSRLFREFNISESEYILEKEKSYNKKTKKTEIYNVLSFDVAKLKINLVDLNGNSANYRKLHFDIKQLICHLIAIAKSGNKPATLQYVFYKPCDTVVKKYRMVDKLYEELKREINAIFDENTKIAAFCKKHNITLAKPQFVPVDKIIDLNYEKLYK